MSRRIHQALSIASLVFLLPACSEPQCPDGYDKVGNVCRRHDAGSVETDASAVARGGAGDDDSGAQRDAEPSQDAEPGRVAPEAGTSGAQDATMQVDSRVSDAGLALDAETDSAARQPMGECDSNRPCSAGYSCVDAKCVSACEQTKCDPNATCAISAGAAVCSCNNGYIAQGSGKNPSCVRDVACSELNCDVNATCEVGADQLRHCVCKAGYTGSGTSCTPVSCEPLTIQNGTVSGGTTYNETATYQCNTGYELDLFFGSRTRKCGADKQWTGSAARCNPVSCGAPPAISNASVQPSSAGTFGATATYTCDSGYEATGSRQVTCGESKSWSKPPTCSPLCGNGRVDRPLEECDPSVPGTSKWSCSATCRKQTMYNACFESSECIGIGETCYLNTCTKTCTSDVNCPGAPWARCPRAATLPAADIVTSRAAIAAISARRDSRVRAAGLTCVVRVWILHGVVAEPA